jgi:alpha-glucosidase (family GH31 glycosyl hydrolase)
MEGINSLFAKVNFDGLWLDMNEATGFCDGECPSGQVPNRTETLINNLSSKF